MSSPRKPTEIKCPTCGQPTTYFREPVGPFCSARCQMVDLGKWFGEEYRISEPLRPDHFASYEHLEGNPDLPEEER